MYNPKSRDWSKLISACVDLKRHFPEASQPMKDAIDVFCKELSENNVVLANRNSSSYVWKSKSLFKCFCEEFNPALISLFPTNSRAYRLLEKNEINFPLSENLLQKKTCLTISNKFRNIYLYLDNLPVAAFENKHDNLFEVGESCILISEILDCIYIEIGHMKLHWCKFCYRRCAFGKNYCDQHHSTNSKVIDTSFRGENTAYRKAKKIAAKIPAIFLSEWKRARAIRNLMGDDFLIGSSGADFASNSDLSIRAITVENEIKALVLDTQNTIWNSDLAEKWDQEMSNSWPIIHTLFSASAHHFDSWDSYRLALINLLQNNHETTLHPYWIIQMLMEAEVWLTYENIYNDLRRTGTQNNILFLAKEGFKNIEISKKLNISRQHVSKVRKLHSL